jgi:hypothetical protein
MGADQKGGKLYRYYVSADPLKHDAAQSRRVPAGKIECAVVNPGRDLLRSPEMIVRTWRAGKRQIHGLSETEVATALRRLDPLWNELFPVEQARVIQLLIERVDVARGWSRHPATDRRTCDSHHRLERGQARAGGSRNVEAQDQQRRSHYYSAGADCDQEARGS